MNTPVGLFLWYSLLVNFIPTIILFYVIYYVPNKSGKIKRLQYRSENITITSSLTLEEFEDHEVKLLRETNNTCFIDGQNPMKSEPRSHNYTADAINSSEPIPLK